MQTGGTKATTALITLLFVVPVPANAQTTARCGNVTSRAIEEAQTRAQVLERQVSLLQSQEQSEGTESAALRPSQERLLTAMEDLACLQEKSISGTKGWSGTTTFVQVPLFFVTDRNQTRSRGAGDFFGAMQRPVGLEFGQLQAVIPEIGGIRTGLITGARRASRPPGAGRQQLRDLAPVSDEQFWSSLRTAVQASRSNGDSPRILLFVHGFNVSFTEAALAGARLASSMQMPIVPVFYSWPSQGQMLGYWQDEEIMTPSSLRFSSFVETLAAIPDTEVIIVAHSMGSRIVTRSLAELARRGSALGSVSRVILAAADLARLEFTEQWPSLRALKSIRWTMYASSSDFALRLSTFIHRFRRVGETKGDIYIQAGTDTIDASSTTSVFQAFGHSYVIVSPAIATDIADWVSRNLSPASRGLRADAQNGLTFYRFP